MNAEQTLRRNGKSFWFAGLFLPRRVIADAARLYAFCRCMDDLADGAVTEHGLQQLQQARADLLAGTSAMPAVQDFLNLARRYHLSLAAADYMMSDFVQDATTRVAIEDEAGLVRYCYGVAGTVGLLMVPILGAERQQASEPAIHLGIAMQMTNIARDVLEDAENGRRYLPGAWVGQLTAEEIARSAQARATVAAAVARLLQLADAYYANAARGFCLLPDHTRSAIEVAAAVYRHIGVKLAARHHEWWRGRVVVSFAAKVWIALQVKLGRSPLGRLAGGELPAGLSQALAGLPGAP